MFLFSYKLGFNYRFVFWKAQQPEQALKLLCYHTSYLGKNDVALQVTQRFEST